MISTFKCLLIEDNHTDACLIMDAAKEIGSDIEFQLFPNGESAIEYLQLMEGNGISQRPDLIILDWILPGIGGKEVLNAIRGNGITKSLPVVIFSVSDDPGDIRDAYSEHASSYVVKPWTLRNLPL
ncbi:MAG: response regulator [Bacteroidota bacterium]|nr:response regulator [Bacteroidota bacterium]